MPGDFLPPIVTKLDGSIDGLEDAVRRAKELIATIGDATIKIAADLDVNSVMLAVEKAERIAQQADATIKVTAEADKASLAKIDAIRTLASKPITVPVQYDHRLINGLSPLARDTRIPWKDTVRRVEEQTGSGFFRDLLSHFGGSGSGGGFFSGLATNAGNTYSKLPWQAQLGIPAALVGGGGIASALIEAMLPTFLGLGIGSGGAIGAYAMGSSAVSNIQKLQSSLASAKGDTRKDALESQITQLQQQYGAAIKLYNAGQGITGSLSESFLKSLSLPGLGFSGAPAGHPGISFLAGLVPIFNQLAGFVKTLTPMLGAMFRASLPYLQMFTLFMEQATKTLLPSFTQLLQGMTPFLPVIGKGLLAIVQGFAGFLNALGPRGFQIGAQAFMVGAEGIRYALEGIGKTINFLAVDFGVQIELIHKAWDSFRHGVAETFDSVRHFIASAWDAIWQQTTGRLVQAIGFIMSHFDGWRHDISSWYDNVGAFINNAWNTIWTNTNAIVNRGISAVISFFQKLPGQILHALLGLGTDLYNLGKNALQMLLNGMKALAHPILGFVDSIGHGIMHIFDVAIGRRSPSKAFYGAGEDIMRGLYNGIQAHENRVYGKVGSVGGNVVSWIRTALAADGAPASWLGAYERLVQLESGGSPSARNPSGASGIAQMMPATFAAYSRGGSIWNPIANLEASIRYVMANYGSPYNIPGLFSGNYRGYATGTGNASPGWAMVGENGPELLMMHGGESVTPMGDGDIVIEQHIHLDGKEIAKNTQRYARAYGRRNGSRGSGNTKWVQAA